MRRNRDRAESNLRLVSIMKTMLGCLAAGFLGAGDLFATPDHAVEVKEQFFGSNATDYAVLRTEDDNQASYYKSRVTTWLDEYSKEDTMREKVKSTLLLDVSYHRSPDQKPDAPTTQEVHSQDATLPLALLLARYPQHATEPWTAENRAKLSVDPVRGIDFGNVFFFDGGVISREIFGGRHEGDTWTLDHVGGDANAIYLQLSCGQDQGRETRLLCLPPGRSKQVRDQLTMQPIYLVAGTFATEEAAVASARELVKKAGEMKFYGIHPEIWSARPPTDKVVWHVVERFSTEMMESNAVPRAEAALGIRLVPMTSKSFIERTVVER